MFEACSYFKLEDDKLAALKGFLCKLKYIKSVFRIFFSSDFYKRMKSREPMTRYLSQYKDLIFLNTVSFPNFFRCWISTSSFFCWNKFNEILSKWNWYRVDGSKDGLIQQLNYWWGLRRRSHWRRLNADL